MEMMTELTTATEHRERTLLEFFHVERAFCKQLQDEQQ